MKSNVCNIQKGALDLGGILTETEKVTRYNGLTKKQSLSLRLLAEELVSMLPSMVRGFSGAFWIENEGNDYELHVKMSVEDMDILTRDSLIKIATNQKNASAVGITGKIRAVFDYMALGGEDTAVMPPVDRYGFAWSMDYSCAWSLREYKSAVPTGEKEKWDELEKSIIARIADDVIVGVKGKTVRMIIKKSFEETKE